MPCYLHHPPCLCALSNSINIAKVPIPPPSSSSAPAAFASIPTPLPFADASDSAAARWTSKCLHRRHRLCKFIGILNFLLYIYVPSSPCRLHLAVFTPPSQFANNSPHTFLPVFACCAVCVPPVPFASTPTRARAFSLSLCVLCALSGGGGVLMMDKLGRFESAVADLTSTVQRLEMEKTNQAEEVEG